MEPVKLAIIGCGIAARDLHYPALISLRNKFEIIMVCNHTEDKARDFAKMVGGVPWVRDYHEVLANSAVDAVDIALPIDLNYEVCRAAIEAGKHVILEKPLAANLDQAQALVDLAERHNGVYLLAENFRYRPGLQGIKDLLMDGHIGRPYALIWNYHGLLEKTNKYARTKWRIKHHYEGGFITDGGVHNIAGIRFLAGNIIKYQAMARQINPAIGEMDTFSMHFDTDQGISGTLNLFQSSNGYYENKVLLLGTDGALKLEDGILTLHHKDQVIEKITFEEDKGYTEEFEDFYQAVQTGSKVISDFKEGYKDLEIMLGAVSHAQKWRFNFSKNT